MKLLPYDTFELVVPEPLPQVRERLMENVGAQSFWDIFSSAEEKPFTGKVEENTFRIYRIIHYRNSFLPILNGVFEHHPTGTRISVKMRLHIFVMMFLLVWIGAAISFAFPFTAVAFWAEIGQAGVMVGVVLLMTYAGFWFEAKKSKKEFLEIFGEVVASHSAARGLR